MTTRSKLNAASFTASTMAFLNVFARPLGIPEALQWPLLLGIAIPLGLVFFYIKKQIANDSFGASQESIAQKDVSKNVKTKLVALWILAALISLASPLWLPITGVSLGLIGDLLVGLIGALVVSAIFCIPLKKEPNQPTQPTRSTRG